MTASRRSVLAEDGSGAPYVLSSTPGGPYLIARNQLNDSEFCGPTLAVTGPWERYLR